MTAAPIDDQLFQSVFEGTLDARFLVDDDGTYIDVNDGACDLFGRDKAALIGTSISDYVAPDAEFQPMWESFLEDGTATGTLELHRPDGEARTVEFAADADIQPGTHLLSCRDISERQEYRRMLELQNRRLEEYSATVSHDLRTPLSIASGWLNVAIEEESTEPLGKVEEALTRMGDLITDLRALGRHGQTVNEMTTVDLEALVSDVWSDLETGTATLDIEEGIGTVHGEKERLLQLFENLLRNAIEHAGPDVTVRVGPLTNGFFVADDGPGIPEDKRESVFEFGYSTTEHGRGIGLAIVEAIADAHGWQFALIDAEPEGTRFEFRTGWDINYDRA